MTTTWILIPLLLLSASLLLSYLNIYKYKHIKQSLSEDEGRIIDFLKEGSLIILKHFYKYLIFTTIGFLIITISFNFLNHSPYYRMLLAVPAVIVSVIIGYLALKLSLNTLKTLLSIQHKSSQQLFDYTKKSGLFIVTVIISIILIDILIWINGLDFIISHNPQNIYLKVAESLGLSLTPELIQSSLFINKKNLLIATSLGGYILGSCLHTFLARFNFGIFATSFDTSSDLIGHLNYDLPEDDLRNPGSIPDLIGDQLKNNYLMFMNIYTSTIMIIVLEEILGCLILLIKDIKIDSVNFLNFPIFFVALGLFFTNIIQSIFNKFSIWKPNSLIEKTNKQFLIALFMSVTATLLVQNGLLHPYYLPSIYVGTFGSLLIYPIIHYFISPLHKPIQHLKSQTKESILNSLTGGLSLGFLGSFIICCFVSILMGIHFKMNHDSIHFLESLYFTGMIVLSLLVTSLPFYAESLSKPLLDNASGISEMLSTNQDIKKKFKDIHNQSTTTKTYFDIINAISITFIVWITSIFIILKSLDLKKFVYFNKDYNFNGSTDTILINFDISTLIMTFQIHCLNVKFFIGILLGIGFLVGLIALTLIGISICCKKIIKLTKNELSTNPSIWKGTECPDYFKLISSITSFNNILMLSAILGMSILMISLWIFLEISGMIGFLIGQITTGLILSMVFFLSGAAWSSNKYSIETDPNNIGKPIHISAIFTDKLGDIFKDGMGPVIIDSIKFIILLAIIITEVILNHM